MQALLKDKHKEQSTALSTLDTRLKLGISASTSIATIVFSSIEAQFLLLIASTIYVMFLGKYKMIAISYTIMAIVSCIAYCFSIVLPMVFPNIPTASLASFAIPFMRMLIMINVVLPLAFSTPIQSLLNTLKTFRLPLYIYIPIAIMIRFIPSCIADAKQILEAVAIRGYPLGFVYCMKHPILSFRVFFIPMLFRTLLSADALSISAELKGLGYSEKMSIYIEQKWSAKETIISIVVCMIFVLASIISIYTERVTGGMP